MGQLLVEVVIVVYVAHASYTTSDRANFTLFSTLIKSLFLMYKDLPYGCIFLEGVSYINFTRAEFIFVSGA